MVWYIRVSLRASRGCSMRVTELGALIVVHVEAAPRFFAEPAGSDEILQQHGRAIFRIAELVLEHLGDRQHRVEADQIRELEWPHRVIEPEARAAVDVFCAARAFFQR